MPHEFEVHEEIVLEATPEQVWDAIAKGPGIDSWFMGRNEVDPVEGGAVRMTLMGVTSESTVTAWEPSKHLAYRGVENPDGTFMAFEYLIEARDGGSTVLRFVHNGFLGDNWEAEYDALSKGDAIYLKKLATYLKHFPGRTSAFNLFLPGPQLTDKERVWAAFGDALGLTGTVVPGDKVRLTVEGLPVSTGVVEFTDSREFLIARTTDALLTLGHGYQDMVFVEQHTFSADADEKEIEQAWQTWFARSLA
ncbi:SRPBCC domain-containing protein [Planotetraspora sp. GP83]|uniref:SRPBCC family protein n=1 Tax=Planotetraspora sp. GP83 TaxID=3156264 RepID=UPI003513AD61